MRGFAARELFCRCKNRARTSILRATWPITPAGHAEIVAGLQRHTRAPAHVAESAYNEALAELAEDLQNLDVDRVLAEAR